MRQVAARYAKLATGNEGCRFWLRLGNLWTGWSISRTTTLRSKCRDSLPTYSLLTVLILLIR